MLQKKSGFGDRRQRMSLLQVMQCPCLPNANIFIKITACIQRRSKFSCCQKWKKILKIIPCHTIASLPSFKHHFLWQSTPKNSDFLFFTNAIKMKRRREDVRILILQKLYLNYMLMYYYILPSETKSAVFGDCQNLHHLGVCLK